MPDRDCISSPRLTPLPTPRPWARPWGNGRPRPGACSPSPASSGSRDPPPPQRGCHSLRGRASPAWVLEKRGRETALESTVSFLRGVPRSEGKQSPASKWCLDTQPAPSSSQKPAAGAQVRPELRGAPIPRHLLSPSLLLTSVVRARPTQQDSVDRAWTDRGHAGRGGRGEE